MIDRSIKIFISLLMGMTMGLSQELESAANTQEQISHASKKTPPNLTPYKKSAFSILSDNDAYYDAHTDYYYTAGTALMYTTKEFDFCNSFGRFFSLNALNKRLSRLSFSIHQDIYTPIKRDKNVDFKDFPYAGFLAFETGIANRRINSLEVIKLQIGMIGPIALAKQTQALIHHITNNPIFYGWDTQLQNEFALNVYYDFIYQYHLFEIQRLAGLSMDILPSIAFGIGNVATYGSAGGRIRLGYGLNNDFGSPKINTSSSGSLPYRDDFSFYIFAGVMGKYIIRDAFIQGNSFHPRSLRLENTNYNGEIGISISYKGFLLSYVFTQVGKGFRGALPYHNFASLILSFAF